MTSSSELLRYWILLSFLSTLVYHNSLQTMLSCTQCPHNLFTAKSCILYSVLYSLLHLTWQPGSCSRHRYNKTTAVTMPVLVSCVAWALPPTLTITITSPLQQDCKHSQQTLSVVISAELLLAGRRTDNTITFMSSLWTTSLLNQFSSSFFPAGLSLVTPALATCQPRCECAETISPCPSIIHMSDEELGCPGNYRWGIFAHLPKFQGKFAKALKMTFLAWKQFISSLFTQRSNS